MKNSAQLPTLLLALPLVAACAATSTQGGEPPAREPAGECDASAVQDQLGRRATADTGEELLRLSGARVLRWVPPRSAVTMDFRADRLTVAYDDSYSIVQITCG